MPMRWPRQQVRKALSARTPRSSGSPTRCACARAGARCGTDRGAGRGAAAPCRQWAAEGIHHAAAPGMIGADRRTPAHHMGGAAPTQALDIREGHGNRTTESKPTTSQSTGSDGLSRSRRGHRVPYDRAGRRSRSSAPHGTHAAINRVFRHLVDQALKGLSGHSGCAPARIREISARCDFN